uniref:NADH-ubiquinone oxidoreductase chain 2 n=1 Tax=Tomocerus qinae TaxID=1765738 RepID=A0A6H0EYV5_9HEXA|nr:NADH dehydrogenase subunit 2 [Tomocerus qinae]
MFMKFYEMIFIMLLLMGTIIAVSTSCWFTSWLGLELNLLMMIPLIINKFNSSSTESVIKYFLVQAMSSILFIIFSLMNFMMMKTNFSMNMENMIMIALIMKAGIPPLHFWFPQIMEYMEWAQCFIMLTWQKIAPFMLLSFMFNKLMIFIMMTSVIIGTLGGFNQSSLKKILTYSSIIHSGWMMAIIMNNMKIWMNYFLIYSIISFSIIWTINQTFFKNIKSIMNMKSNLFFKIIFSMNIFSLAGLPPFLGFLGKFMVVVHLLEVNFNLFILTMLISSSLIGLFFYMKMMYSMLMISMNHMNFIFLTKKNNNSTMMITMTIFLNLIMPSFILLT